MGCNRAQTAAGTPVIYLSPTPAYTVYAFSECADYTGVCT